MGVGLEDTITSVVANGRNSGPDGEVRTGEGKAAVIPHGLGSSSDGLGNELGLGNGVTDRYYGRVRAQPKAMVYGVRGHSAFFTHGIDFIVGFIQPRLSPHGVAKSGFIHTFLFAGEGTFTSTAEDLFCHVNVGGAVS